jgi:hypothetical protein
MQFRLVYEGELPAAGTSSRAPEKHQIRKVLHKQLARLWREHPFLNEYLKEFQEGIKYIESEHGGYVFMEDPDLHVVAEGHAILDYRFIPLIGKSFGASACSLDILFLRRDHPGGLIRSGGDIDNRIKVLFDALRMPQNSAELCGQTPESGETPFFCLLEDDQLITEVKVTTDRLLTASESGSENPSDVHLIIHVKTLVSGSDGQAAFLA